MACCPDLHAQSSFVARVRFQLTYEMQYLILHFASFHFRLHFKRVSFTTIGFVLVIATFTFWDVMPTQIHPLDGDPIITVHATEEKAPNEVRIVLCINSFFLL